MTLNVTVLTPDIIYQSADFRLTNPRTGKPFLVPSPKTVTLGYWAWNGFITYTGVGSWRDRDTSGLILEWLTGIENPSMADVAGLIANKGTALLQSIERRYLRMRHTFTMAGFDDHGPRAYVISNFEDCFGDSRDDIGDHLTVTARTLGRGKKATVIVTGCKGAVPSTERRVLASVAAKFPGDSLRIRRRMAKLNSDAAPRSKNTVSPECVVLSYRSDGTGAMLLDRDSVETPQQFPHIMNGVDVNKSMTEALKGIGFDLAKARTVQIGYASAQHGKQATVQQAPCNYAVIDADPSTGYIVAEITAADFKLVGPRDISNRGQAVGTGRVGFRTDQPQNIPWSYLNGEVERLNYAGLAPAVNQAGRIVAVLQGPAVPGGGTQRAAFYDGGALIELPLYEDDSYKGKDSEASAINNAGLIAGSVNAEPRRPGIPNMRAAVFRSGQPTIVFNGLVPEFGSRAFDVNEQGQVLLMVGVGPSNVRSVLWNPFDGSWHYVGDDTANVFPIAVTDENVVLGQARNSQNQPVAVVCQPGGSWERLGTPDKWVPVDINNRGEVLGRVMIDMLERPWLHSPGKGVATLPYVTDHHTNVSAVNDAGLIIGSAAADGDSHVFLWTPG